MGPWLGQVRLAQPGSQPRLGQFWDFFGDLWSGVTGSGTEEVNAACYTCADPSGVESPQYGIPAGAAADLQNKGWDCRKDDCAAGYSMLGPRFPLAQGLGRRALL